MLRTTWTLRPAALRIASAFAVLAIVAGTMTTSGAHITDGVSFEEHFEYASGTPLLQSANGSQWILDPPVPAGWIVETRPTALNTGTLGTMSVLAAKQKQGPPLDPIAFVTKNIGNFVAQTQAAFDGTVPANSGIGIVFHAAIDPNTSTIDRNNLYLFTSINTTPNPRTFPTGHAFMIFKRNQGTYYMAAPPVHTYVDFSNSTLHTYKVGMSGQRIQAWVDGLQFFDIQDTAGSDTIAGGYSMPGPAIVTGAIGLRTSRTAALFDDLFVVGAPAYEARAQAVNVYGRLGTDTGVNTALLQAPAGTERVITGGDSGWQYHDHDFTQSISGPAVSGPAPIGAAAIVTSGKDGVTTTSAQLAGITGIFSDPSMKTFVTISADLAKAVASASCVGTNSTVDVVNFTWAVLSFQHSQPDLANPTEAPTVQQGNVTRLNAPPNMSVLDPNNSTGPAPMVGPVDPNTAISGAPVRITLHSRRTSTDPQRVEAAAIRITFFTDSLSGPNNVRTPGNVLADVALGDATAGKLCVAL
ncbi:MAG: hypothetical protein ABR548_00835 [Actinomycetota bacterium]|nr:hypothetical protein [Actinomycetota bacterium]